MEQQIQRSIIKKYRKQIWNRFIGALKDYRLINRGDRVAVCISGGKDSFLLACCIKELQLHSSVPFEAEYLVMDPGYKEENLSLIRRNAALTELPVHIFQSPIFEVVSHAEGSPCYLCARMRRGYLYKEAQKLGCNKIALGHNKDDVVETFFMSLLYEGRLNCFAPVSFLDRKKLYSIRPLMYVPEWECRSFVNKSDIHIVKNPCLADGNTKRQETKELLAELSLRYDNLQEKVFGAIKRSSLKGWNHEE